MRRSQSATLPRADPKRQWNPRRGAVFGGSLKRSWSQFRVVLYDDLSVRVIQHSVTAHRCAFHVGYAPVVTQYGSATGTLAHTVASASWSWTGHVYYCTVKAHSATERRISGTGIKNSSTGAGICYRLQKYKLFLPARTVIDYEERIYKEKLIVTLQYLITVFYVVKNTFF